MALKAKKEYAMRVVLDEYSKYEIPVTMQRLAIWERYIPYCNPSGLFADVKEIWGRSPKEFVDEKMLLSSKIRMESLHHNLTSLINLRQSEKACCFRAVECGTGQFRSSRLIVKLLQRAIFAHKYFVGYDTFEGLPLSEHNPLPALVGKYAGSIEEFNEIFSEFKFVSAVKGLIPNTLTQVDYEYDFVHVDLDLYEGTISSLKHFFPLLKHRGVIQLDDYNNYPWAGVNDAVDEFLGDLDRSSYMFTPLCLGGAFIVKI